MILDLLLPPTETKDLVTNMIANDLRLVLLESCIRMRVSKQPMRDLIRAWPGPKLVQCGTAEAWADVIVLVRGMTGVLERRCVMGHDNDSLIRLVCVDVC